MERPTSPSPPSDELRSRVVETIRKRWTAPVVCDRPAPPPPARVEDVARAVLDAMLTRPFRVGQFPTPEVYQQLFERVRLQVRRNRPICVSLGYAPLKNPNSVECGRADWAEFFALCHLAAWHNKVQALYPPGLSIQLVFDDSTLAMANRADRVRMNTYIDSIGELVRVLKFEAIFPKPFRQSSFSWLFHFGLYGLAGFLVRRWERNPANRECLEQMTEAARRNVVVPTDLSPEARERFIRDASHRYRVYWEALQLSGFTRGKDRLIAMYLDGSQHHLKQMYALHMTTLAKGQVTQPWQGEGTLLDNGHGKLDPFVLTGGRRPRYSTRTVAGLDVVSSPGFDRITVAWPIEPALPLPREATVGAVAVHPGPSRDPAL